MGSFGLDMPDLQSQQQALVGDENLINESSLRKSLSNLWHRLQQWQHCNTAAKTEEIMMNPSSIGQV